MRKNLAHNTIYMLRQYGFSWINHKAISNIHKIDQTIEEIMGNKWYSNNRQALRKHRIMFIGQCLNLNSTKLLEWTQLTNPKEQGKKCKPQWYSELENKIILSNNPDRRILYTQPQENIFHQYIEGSLTKAIQIKWTASMKQYNIIIGKKK